MEHGAQNIRLAVVGNKLDLDDDREVSIDEGKKVRLVQSPSPLPSMKNACLQSVLCVNCHSSHCH